MRLVYSFFPSPFQSQGSEKGKKGKKAKEEGGERSFVDHARIRRRKQRERKSLSSSSSDTHTLAEQTHTWRKERREKKIDIGPRDHHRRKKYALPKYGRIAAHSLSCGNFFWWERRGVAG